MKILSFIKQNVIVFSSILVLTLIISNTAIIIYNNRVLEKTANVRIKAERAKKLTNVISEMVKSLEIGLRGFALTKEEQMLMPFNEAASASNGIVQELDSILKAQKFTKSSIIKELDLGISNFIDVQQRMVELVRKDNMDEFRKLLKEDTGKDLSLIYAKASTQINQFENVISLRAEEEYKAAHRRTLWIQIILLIIGAPTLIFTIYKIKRDKKERQNLFLELEENNRKYLFNPGIPFEVTNEKELINNSIENYKNAAKFINQISQGNYDVEWEQINDQNKEFNKNNLTGELLEMREKMKKLKDEDERRNWTTGGLAKFSEVIRNYQNNLQSLCYEVLVFLVKYMGAQQGGLFIVREEENGSAHMELISCYAFNKKKHIEKRIEVGQGLVGQSYMEKQNVMLTEIPQGYTHITSGLGEETPKCLLIIPMKYNDKVEAVIEIAGFSTYEPYQIEFMERVGEITASTLGAVKNNERTKALLDQFKMQTEHLRAQEEELRQNMEEMEATQEALKRQERENEGLSL